ncbi:MAG: hypothetical protein RLZZ245_1041, partial [Verrucomicrobiota bacterium]
PPGFHPHPPMLVNKRLALAGVVFGLLGLNYVSAQASLNFSPFEIQGVSNPSDLDYIDIDGQVVSSVGGVTIGIVNSSIPGDGWITSQIPTITTFLFQDQANVLSVPTIQSASPGVSIVQNNNLNLPGGNNIGFTVESGFRASNPSVKKGLDPNEFVYFFFGGSSYELVLAGLASGQVKIGMHVQEIGLDGEDSASYVNNLYVAPNDGGGGSGNSGGGGPDVIPEPSSALLTLVGAALLFRRRR